jgi:hypothetical protein
MSCASLTSLAIGLPHHGRTRHLKHLDVELIFLRGGARTVSALIGGSVDFILGSDLGITTAIIQGASLTRVGVTTNTLGYSMVVQPGIKTVHPRVIIASRLGATPLASGQTAPDNGMTRRRDLSVATAARRGGGAVERDPRDHVHPPSDKISESRDEHPLSFDVATAMAASTRRPDLSRRTGPGCAFCAVIWKGFTT